MSFGETRRRGDLPAPLAAFSRVLDVLASVTIALAGSALVALVVMTPEAYAEWLAGEQQRVVGQ